MLCYRTIPCNQTDLVDSATDKINMNDDFPPGGVTPYILGTAGVPTSRVPFSPKRQEKGCVFSHQNAREGGYILSKNAREMVCLCAESGT